MTVTRPHIAGVILAGGRSTRFGSNKAFARWQGVPLIFHVLKLARYLFSEVLLVTNNPEEYRKLPAKVLADDPPERGPLGGIATAMHYTSKPYLFVFACDTPLLTIDDVQKMTAAGKDQEAVIPRNGQGQPSYTTALYSCRLLPDMKAFLKGGGRSLKDFFKNRSRIVWVALRADATWNVNTQSDLAYLEGRRIDVSRSLPQND